MQSPCIDALSLTLGEQSNSEAEVPDCWKKPQQIFILGEKKMKMPEDCVRFLNLLPVISPVWIENTHNCFIPVTLHPGSIQWESVISFLHKIREKITCYHLDKWYLKFYLKTDLASLTLLSEPTSCQAIHDENSSDESKGRNFTKTYYQQRE